MTAPKDLFGGTSHSVAGYGIVGFQLLGLCLKNCGLCGKSNAMNHPQKHDNYMGSRSHPQISSTTRFSIGFTTFFPRFGH